MDSITCCSITVLKNKWHFPTWIHSLLSRKWMGSKINLGWWVLTNISSQTSLNSSSSLTSSCSHHRSISRTSIIFLRISLIQLLINHNLLFQLSTLMETRTNSSSCCSNSNSFKATKSTFKVNNWYSTSKCNRICRWCNRCNRLRRRRMASFWCRFSNSSRWLSSRMRLREMRSRRRSQREIWMGQRIIRSTFTES